MIAREDLIEGAIYVVRARNFSVGVWTGHNTFVGRRQKFGAIYLDEEVLDGSIPLGGVTERIGQFVVPVPLNAVKAERWLPWLDALQDEWNKRWRLEQAPEKCPFDCDTCRGDDD